MPDDLFQVSSLAGVRRDGTLLDDPYYSQGQWVRFQRGKPRKMGGYRGMSQDANGPVRSVLVDSRNGVNSAHIFSQWGVQRQEFSSTGAGGSLENRTPLEFTPDSNFTWSHGLMYSSVGSGYTALLAAATPDVLALDSDAAGAVYQGDVKATDPLQQVYTDLGPLLVSGGVCVLQPFLFAYGSNGLIRNSNANDFSAATGWLVGGGKYANQANVAGTKFVYGAPIRGGGQSPSGLFWAIDSLVRVSFVGGDALWSYDTLSQPTSIMSKKCVVEHDGKFYWMGSDRFLFYNGVVQELPNQMNLNWVYDNLNFAHRNKVWGTKVPRWGEIWWFYPRGTDTECGHAVIYNYREDTWYDAALIRSAGSSVQLFPFPVMAGGEDFRDTKLISMGTRLRSSAASLSAATTLTFSATTGVANNMVVTSSTPGLQNNTRVSSFTGTVVTLDKPLTADMPLGTVFKFSTMTSIFTEGATVTGATSGATGRVARVMETELNLSNVAGTFINGEVLNGSFGGTATARAAPVDQPLVTVYQHEFGYDKVLGQEVTAIPSSFTTKNFGFAVGSPFDDVPKTVDLNTRVLRFEPDFNQTATMKVSILGRAFAQDSDEEVDSQEFESDTQYVDLRGQDRILTLKIESNDVGGHFEQGSLMLKLAPGDERSTAAAADPVAE